MVRKKVNLPGQFEDAADKANRLRKHHREDKGCRISPSCLSCLLEHCILDKPWSNVRSKGALYHDEIIEKYNAGWKTKDIAASVGLTQRTIERMINRYFEKKDNVQEEA